MAIATLNGTRGEVILLKVPLVPLPSLIILLHDDRRPQRAFLKEGDTAVYRELLDWVTMPHADRQLQTSSTSIICIHHREL